MGDERGGGRAGGVDGGKARSGGRRMREEEG